MPWKDNQQLQLNTNIHKTKLNEYKGLLSAFYAIQPGSRLGLFYSSRAYIRLCTSHHVNI